MRSMLFFLGVLFLAASCHMASAADGDLAPPLTLNAAMTDAGAARAAASLQPSAGITASVAAMTSPPASTATVEADAVDDGACPAGMVLVEGDFCPDVRQRCLEWMDPPGRYHHFRCKRYAKPAVCASKKRKHLRFCIDEKERTVPGGDLPRNHMSWTTATKLCKASGARLCMAHEWVFACEGEEMRPYPYGWQRDSSICNADIDHGLGHIGRLVDHRAPASAHPQCKSAFGIHDMAGNVDEWTTIAGMPRGKREIMHGSWWMPGRNACRSFQAGHGPLYAGTETGARCCADPLK